jgi:hypothetical protein
MQVIVVTATCNRKDASGNWIDYFGEGGKDLLYALSPGASEEAIRANILQRLNAYLDRCGHGPEHHFGPEHMDHELDMQRGHVDWQYDTVEVDSSLPILVSGWVRWGFDEGRDHVGWTDGTTWNGFANVWVTPAVRDELYAELLAQDQFETCVELRDKKPDDRGLISLAGGYCAHVRAYLP